MASLVSPYSITAPGFYGLNTQDSPVDLDTKFALVATNCVIDKYGRVGARKGWTKVTSVNSDLTSTGDIECVGEVITNAGVSTILCAGNGFLFKYGSGTLTTLTYGGGGVAPTINADNWQFCQLNGVGMFWQRGYDPLIYDPAVSTTTFRRLSEKSGSSGTIYQCNTAISAYGRVWAADTSSDKNTVVWSDILTPHIWTGGTSGSLDLRNVWPLGGDEIVSLAAHNNFLYIFGKRQILVYQGADNPATMKLTDSIETVGCVGRDTVQPIGDDVIFMSDTGVRSILRTIQEKSAPIRTLSRNVTDDIKNYLDNESSGSTVKSAYSPTDAFYLLSFPASGIIYCFDLRTQLPDGSSRVTIWDRIRPKSFFYSSANRVLYLGMTGYLSTHTGYNDDTSRYRMFWYSTWIDFGQPIRQSILKKITMILAGTVNQEVFYKWGFDYISASRSNSTILSNSTEVAEYGIAEYGESEYSQNIVVRTVSVPAGGYGRVIQVGMEAEINGSGISVQRVDIFTKDGRV